MLDYIIRKATNKDINFIIEAIIEAEKSNTDKLPLSTLFDLTEEEVKKILFSILNEDIDGCEFSLSSFIVAEHNGKCVAAIGGWVEAMKELSSAAIKANIFNYFMPSKNIQHLNKLQNLIKDIQIERLPETYQLEYVYVKKEYRGNNLFTILLNYHIEKSNSLEVYIQVFGNNKFAIKSYEKSGFEIYQIYHSNNKEINNYLPDDTKILMKLNRNKKWKKE
ncbi:MAG TPA: GNAT family N-acetyltransferase [Bacteroidales bacterium]|nr:GNAT family N-acetyltransferase [Bacteroidales bacterium]